MSEELAIKNSREIKQLKHYTLVIGAAWLVIITGSFIWSLSELGGAAMDLAVTQAKTAFEKDVLYRRWNALMGGVYVPVTDDIIPNPYLDPEGRDIETTTGEKLTKINPAYMTRQVHEIQQSDSGVKGHITSLDPIRPANAADAWETEVLNLFEDGIAESSSLETMEGVEYLRFMQPLIVEESCISCHADQGYKVGEIRGGISVSVPMAQTWKIIGNEQMNSTVIHSVIFFLGLGGLMIGYRRLNSSIRERSEFEQRLILTNQQLTTEIEKRKKAQAELLRIQAAVEDASDAILILDLEGKINFSNSAFGDWFSEDVIKQGNRSWENLFFEPEKGRDAFESALKSEHLSIEVQMHGYDKGLFPALMRVTSILNDDHDCEGVLFIFTDISERKAFENKLRELAELDGLTTLPNRRTFDESLNREWHRLMRSGLNLAIIMIDIDNFKLYNDTYGHQIGDACLVLVARTIESVIKRPADLVARYGGEEFVCMLPETDVDGAVTVAESIKRAIEKMPLEHSSPEVSDHVTVSLGVAAMRPPQGEESALIVAKADAALYEAKRAGRNMVKTADA